MISIKGTCSCSKINPTRTSKTTSDEGIFACPGDNLKLACINSGATQVVIKRIRLTTAASKQSRANSPLIPSLEITLMRRSIKLFAPYEIDFATIVNLNAYIGSLNLISVGDRAMVIKARRDNFDKLSRVGPVQWLSRNPGPVQWLSSKPEPV